MDTNAGSTVAMAGVLLLAIGAFTQVNSEAPGDRRSNPSPVKLRLVQSQPGGSPSKDFLVQDVNGRSGQPALIRITLPSGEYGEFSYLMFRGLPDGVKMSVGFPLKESWAVSLKDVSKLSLMAPDGFSGAFQLEASLYAGRDALPQKRLVNVTIQPTAVSSQSKQPDESSFRDLTSAPLPGRDVPEKPAMKSVSPEEEDALMARAEEALRSADIAAARLLYEHLAQQGSAKGAFAMAQTFDPEFLKTLFVKGLKPDVPKAKEWYAKAKEFGHSGAGQRLMALSSAN